MKYSTTWRNAGLFAALMALVGGSFADSLFAAAIRPGNRCTRERGHQRRRLAEVSTQLQVGHRCGSRSHDDYVETMAFLLQQNGYPAGGPVSKERK